MVVKQLLFSKAFDVVQHDTLFANLRALGIDGFSLEWISNLLNFINRIFQTRINDMLSTVCDLLSNVIQGSADGPVELLNNYSITVKLFANDVKLYITVSRPTPSDMVELQKAFVCPCFLGRKMATFGVSRQMLCSKYR